VPWPPKFLEIVFYIYFFDFLINQMHSNSLFKILGLTVRLCLKSFNSEKNFLWNLFIGVGPSDLNTHLINHWTQI
jgi:hypothetical protein